LDAQFAALFDGCNHPFKVTPLACLPAAMIPHLVCGHDHRTRPFILQRFLDHFSRPGCPLDLKRILGVKLSRYWDQPDCGRSL